MTVTEKVGNNYKIINYYFTYIDTTDKQVTQLTSSKLKQSMAV